MARNPRQLLQPRRELAELLDSHLKRGQSAEIKDASRWKPWTNANFAAQVEVSPNSVANWRNAASPVPPDDIVPVLDALFGDHQPFAHHRRALKECWERAKGLVPEEYGPSEEARDWALGPSVAYTDLAEAILHQPAATNSAQTYRLQATLRLGPVELNDETGRAVVVGLREVFFGIRGSGYQVAQHSLLGERSAYDHIEPGVSGFTVKGPLKDGSLHGSPFGEDHIAVIEPGAEGDKTVSVFVRASSRAFAIAYAPDPDKPFTPETESPNRSAVLGLLLSKEVPRDESGRIILARASLRRKVDE